MSSPDQNQTPDQQPPPYALTRRMLENWLKSKNFTRSNKPFAAISAREIHGAFVSIADANSTVWTSPTGRWQVFIPDEPGQTEFYRSVFSLPPNLPIIAPTTPGFTPPELTQGLVVILCLVLPHPTMEGQSVYRPEVAMIDEDTAPWCLFVGEEPPYHTQEGVADIILRRAWLDLSNGQLEAMTAILLAGQLGDMTALIMAEGELAAFSRLLTIERKTTEDAQDYDYQ